jgi:uncharacterized membrane protein YtjA (UPF0391 family)
MIQSDTGLAEERPAELVFSVKTVRHVRAQKVLFLMLYYSGFLAAVAVIMGTLGSVGSSGTTAFIMRLCFIVSFLLFTISLGRQKKARA